MRRVHQRHGQTDIQTDRQTNGRTTYDSNTALCTGTSRGKTSSMFFYCYVQQEAQLPLRNRASAMHFVVSQLHAVLITDVHRSRPKSTSDEPADYARSE